SSGSHRVATYDPTIDALALAGAGADAGGTSLGGALAGAGAGASNKVDNMVTAAVAASGNSTRSFDPTAAGVVNLGADTIAVSLTGLSTGTALGYHTGGGTAIGGLADGGTYYAIVANG